MEEKAVPSTSSSTLKKLEEQLTCAICYQLYTNPKILPCFHSFCQQCLEGLPRDPQGENYISCPTCHHSTLLPQPTGVSDFPGAFHINNLKEIYNLMTKVSEHQEVTCDNCTTTNATGYCKECAKFLCQECINVHKKFVAIADHNIRGLDEVVTSASQLLPMMKCSSHNETLEIFCETCEELICYHCTIRVHRDHEHDLVSGCYPKHCQKLEAILKSVSDKVAAVTDVLTIFTDRENEIKEQGEVIKEEIHTMVEEMIAILQQSERELTNDVDIIIGKKLEVLSDQKKSSEKKLSQLKECQEFVEQSLEICNPQQVITSTKHMMKYMSHVTKQIDSEKHQPKEKADLYFKQDRNIVNIVHYIGDVLCLSPTVLQQCKVSNIDDSRIDINNNNVTFPLSIQFSDSSLLTVPLSSLSCSVVPVDTTTPITAIVTTTIQPGVYTIHCSPVAHTIRVNVQVNDVQVDSTSLVIPFNPYRDNIIPVCIIPELDRPYGVAVTDDGHIIVSENNSNCVTVLDSDGKKVKSFGQKIIGVKFSQPRGVAITPDNFILVTDNHKIQKISIDGAYISSVGRQGSGPLEFDVPRGIAVSLTTDNIYVVDSNNCRIQVLNPDLTFLFMFGTKGTTKGKFDRPGDVTIDKQGVLYITNIGNHRIQLYTSEGQFLYQFGALGSNPGRLICPVGIITDNNDLMYITESTLYPGHVGNNRVSVFTTEGQFVRSFGEPGCEVDQFNSPYGIAFDREGYLYVCDFYNNRLVVY